MSLTILFHFVCAEYVSDINISIIRSLRLLVVLFLVRCVLEFRCGWVGVVSVLQAYTDITPTQPHRNSNTHQNNVVIQQNSRKLLMMDILMFETCWAHKKRNKITSDVKLVFYSSTMLSWNLISMSKVCQHIYFWLNLDELGTWGRPTCLSACASDITR